jgi:hypothetical protein
VAVSITMRFITAPSVFRTVPEAALDTLP